MDHGPGCRIEPELHKFVGMPNSTAYAEVLNTPAVATDRLRKVIKALRDSIANDVGLPDQAPLQVQVACWAWGYTG